MYVFDTPCEQCPYRLRVQLFDFVDLLGFSITLKPSFYNSDVDLFQDGKYPPIMQDHFID
jgi:hypothetical protein